MLWHLPIKYRRPSKVSVNPLKLSRIVTLAIVYH